MTGLTMKKKSKPVRYRSAMAMEKGSSVGIRLHCVYR